MKSGFEESWRRRFIERGRLFDDDAGIAGWTSTGLGARLRNFQRVWPGDAAGAVWLDAGCGAGSYTRYLAESGVTPVGLDYSLPSVRKAQARSEAGIAWMVGDVTRLPVRPGAFDGAMCLGVLQALDGPERAVAELMGAVREGGQVWVDVLNRRCLHTLIRRALARLSGRPLALRYHSAGQIADLMRRHGARDVQVYWVPILPAGLGRLQAWVEGNGVRRVLGWLGPLGSLLSHAVLVSARKGTEQETRRYAAGRDMSRMQRIRESFASTLRSLGWVDGLTYLLAQGLDRISRGRIRIVKYDLVVQPVRGGIGVPEHRGTDLEIRELRPGDELLERMGHPPETIAARFRQGGRCLAAVRRGELAGFLWWVEGPYEEDEVRCLFVPRPAGAAVWDFDVYVAPRHRSGPVFARLWDAASRDLSARGFRQTCSRISAFKPGSLSAHRRLGARVVGKRLFVCVGRLELMFGTRRPLFHASLRSRPTIEVGP